ncbi:MAG: hypothetical protein KAI83_20175 [Thiomargarita sp.]|nr:hypothetical protein [Thiomargarita sp.]
MNKENANALLKDLLREHPELISEIGLNLPQSTKQEKVNQTIRIPIQLKERVEKMAADNPGRFKYSSEVFIEAIELGLDAINKNLMS